MMSIFVFLLNIYFASVLGVAGIAKVDSPHLFMSILRHQYKLPEWSIPFVGRIFPWIEIIGSISLLMTTNIYKFLISAFIFILFVTFFILNILSRVEKHPVNDCGCYGKTLQKSGINTNSFTIAIQVGLAVVLVLGTRWIATLSWLYFYFTSSILFIGVYSWLLWKVWQRRYYRKYGVVKISREFLAEADKNLTKGK